MDKRLGSQPKGSVVQTFAAEGDTLKKVEAEVNQELKRLSEIGAQILDVDYRWDLNRSTSTDGMSISYSGRHVGWIVYLIAPEPQVSLADESPM